MIFPSHGRCAMRTVFVVSKNSWTFHEMMVGADAYKWIILIVQECPGYVKGSTTPYNHQPIVSCEAVHAKNTFSTKQTTHSDKYTDISLILDWLHLRAFRTPALNPFKSKMSHQPLLSLSFTFLHCQDFCYFICNKKKSPKIRPISHGNSH